MALSGTPTGSTYIQVVAVSWIFYDYALTFSDEVQLIWQRPWGWVSLLFVLTRYGGIAVTLERVITTLWSGISQKGCLISANFTTAASFYIPVLVQIILQMRIYLMYHKNRRLLVINGILFILNIVCPGIVASFYLSRNQFIEPPAYILGSCYFISAPQMTAVWAAPLAYELYLCTLAVVKAVRNSHTQARIVGRMPLITLLVRDSVVYFFLIASGIVVNIFIWALTPVTPGQSSISIIHAAGSVGGTRLILSMRQSLTQSPVSQLDSRDLTSIFFPKMRKKTSSVPNTTTDSSFQMTRLEHGMSHKAEEAQLAQASCP